MRAAAAAAADGGSARAAKQAVASLPKGAYRRVLQQVHDVYQALKLHQICQTMFPLRNLYILY